MVESTGSYEEKIKETSLVVHKVSIDASGIKEIVDKKKTKFFAKLGFLKPKREDIDCEAISLYYEPFNVVKARYYVDYYKRNTYNIKVDEKVTEVILLSQKLIPESLKGMKKVLKRPYKELKLDAQERVLYEAAASLAQDRSGHEIDPIKLPSAPAMSDPKQALAEYGDKARKPKIAPDKLIDVIRQKIVSKPSEAEKVIEEVFEVSENSLIYTPIYEARCRYLKTGEIKIIPISGVTGKPFNP